MSTRTTRRTDPLFAHELVALGRGLRAECDAHKLLLRALDGALQCISAANCAGVAVTDHGRFTSEAQTQDVAGHLHSVQFAAGRGPSLDAAQQQGPVLVDDLGGEDRWPEFTACAVEHGVRTVLSVPLFVDANVLGALSFYAGEPGCFCSDDEGVAWLLASQVSMTLAALRARGNFDAALASRDMIGQAKGILMERFKIGDAEAFQILVAVSQRKHLKLRDVADQLTRTGELDI
jgi:GAF domain-containing protein